MASSYFDGINESTLPSWSDSFNYKPSSGILGSGFGSPKWGEAVSAASNYLSQSKKKDEEDKYRNQVAIGNAMQASTSEGPDKYTKIYTPAQQAPVYIQGQEGRPGFGGAIGALAGGLLGSVVPGVGTALGAQLGGALGGSFG